ncbi:hypothetical protein MTR67_000483 [Solanum verrucosum]|uniref:Uncharacterized protein n=1 Tax=Solanum verrucosum TaxID=315347 RepID=A0AAF0PLQ7_SOLVR|nr:hypothetical protein MTR67_000483 [Solanum verrucosum]
MQHLSVLESLDLSSNKIGGEIPQQLASLTSLEVLNLSHNHLIGCIPKGKQFDTFENSSYQGNDGLRGLPLSKDCGSDEGVPQATTPFGLDQEEEEDGDSSMISWQAVLMGYGCGLVIGLSVIYIMLSIRYPVWFSRMDVELEHKILTRMKKYKKGYVTSRGLIPVEISRLSKLQVLSIQSSLLRFETHNFELLLKNLTRLRELHLRSVNISSTIPLNFSSYLTNLELSTTQIYGILPEGVFHLSNLESLDISSNPQLTVRFPTFKWNSSASLMKLNLSNVNATGRIPESFGHLTSLHTLSIASCNLSGSIPKPLWNLTNIEEMFLVDNHLEGPISDFFRFGKLRLLSLGNNSFDGQLEFLSFSRWTQLESLVFSFNFLTGPIPSNVSGMQNLQRLYLSSNLFNGTIPSWIFSLPSLEWLDLSDNHFSGNIQEFKSKTLDRVVLKQNHLQGSSHGLRLWTCYWTVHNIHNVVNSISNMVFEDGCRLRTQNSYENEKAQEKTLVCNLQDSSPLHCWDENKSF